MIRKIRSNAIGIAIGVIIGTLLGVYICFISNGNAQVYGNVADWLSGIGTLVAIIAAIIIAKETSKDNMKQARLDKSIGFYVEDLRAIVGRLSELEHNALLDTLYRGDIRVLTVTERQEAERGIIDRNESYAEIIGYHKMSTIIYRMPEKKQGILRPYMDKISEDLSVVMRMDLEDKEFDDKKFLSLLTESVDNYSKIRDKVSSEITDYSVFE